MIAVLLAVALAVVVVLWVITIGAADDLVAERDELLIENDRHRQARGLPLRSIR